METLDVITERGDKSIKDVIKDQLEKLQDPKKRLSRALHYLSTAVVLEEQVGEIAAESWSYIQVNELWTAGGHASLHEFKEYIYFDDILKATVDRSNAVADRKGREILGILQHWHHHPRDALPKELIPPYFSDNLLRNLHRISKLHPCETAIPLLVAAVQERLDKHRANRYIHSAPYLCPTDVLDVISAIEISKDTKQVRLSTQLLLGTRCIKPPNITSDHASPEASKALSKSQTRGM
jgi:hypothetical protein